VKAAILQLSDVSRALLDRILDVAEDFEQFKSKYGALPPLLKGKTLGMLFDETSLRTRSAFEIAMRDLDGTVLHYRSDEIRIGAKADKTEHLRDFGNVLGGFNDVVLSRIYDHGAQRRLASQVPAHFINGMCDLHHPTQALCDLLTIRRKFSRLDGLKVCFMGDATNVAFSLAEGFAYYDSEFVLSTSPEFGDSVQRFRGLRNFRWEPDPVRAISDAHVVVSDVWVPMNKRHEVEQRVAALRDYRVTLELTARARRDHIFMHNLPANREHEVAPEVIDGERSVIYEEAIARLHIARALLYLLARDGGQA
jgi:ornithine carbamoyltransferase